MHIRNILNVLNFFVYFLYRMPFDVLALSCVVKGPLRRKLENPQKPSKVVFDITEEKCLSNKELEDFILTTTIF